MSCGITGSYSCVAEDSSLLEHTAVLLGEQCLRDQRINVPSHSRSSSLRRLLDRECEGTMIVWYIRKCLSSDSVLHPSRQQSSDYVFHAATLHAISTGLKPVTQITTVTTPYIRNQSINNEKVVVFYSYFLTGFYPQDNTKKYQIL